jgi:CRP-like cAMP-binding protein
MNDEINVGLFFNKLFASDWPLIRKFSCLRQLSHDEINALMKMHKKTRIIDAHKTFLHPGETHKQSWIVTQGWAYRYKSFSNGEQQIINYYLPGDIISPFSSVMPRANYYVASITPLYVCPFSHDNLTELFATSPKLETLFEYFLALEDAILTEQVCRIGRQTAYQRTAHLLLELFQRLKIIGQTERNTFISPLTQQMMADTLGLSTVHMNRTLHKLRNDNLISIMAHKISLLNPVKLKQIIEYQDSCVKQIMQFSVRCDYIEGMRENHQEVSAA